MIVPVAKEVEVPLWHAHARRIRCEHCNGVFSFVCGGYFPASELGLPFSDSETMAHEALRFGMKTVAGFVADPRFGESRCVHCGQYQTWMIEESRKHCTIIGAGLAVVLTILVTLVLFVFGKIGFAHLPRVGAVALVGGVGGALIGRMLAAKPGIRTADRDPRSKTDNELTEWIAMCAGKHTDPFLLWCAQTICPPPRKSIKVSLGLKDEVGGYPVPEPLKAENIIKTATDD